jgi:DNA-binding transcriptional LysR family regulator
MNNARIDLNLLVYLDVLLEEKNVTKAAGKLGITQPAMSNGLKRLRELFGDPLLIRTSSGMTPTERALALRPVIREALGIIEQTVQPQEAFDARNSDRVFRIMTSDYAESTLIPLLLTKIQEQAPHIRLDILTPSDVAFNDIEQAKVDMAINRFDQMPNSFHQKTIWYDNFSCLMSKDNAIVEDFNLQSYISAPHIWVSKTGMGKGVGINPNDVQKFGRVDEALHQYGLLRNITVFTRHYQVAVLLAQQPKLIATLPTRLALMQADNPKLVIKKPPFSITPFELKMAWSPLLQHNHAHQWLRQLIFETRDEILGGEVNAIESLPTKPATRPTDRQ